MRIYIISFLLLLFLLPFSSNAQNVYLEVMGSTQGAITRNASGNGSAGDFSQAGHKDESLVFAMEMTTKNLIDENTGALVGDPIPCVLKLKKLVDSASPQLFRSLVTKEDLELTLRFWRNNGFDEQYYTMEFTGVKVASIRMLSQEEDTYAVPTSSIEFEEISFTYTTVDATHEISGTSASWEFNN